MPDPTTPVLIATFSGALGIFVVTALIRLKGKARPLPIEEIVPAEGTLPPYEPPRMPSDFPPPPVGVPVWFYRKLDFLWAGAIFALFAYLSIANAELDESKAKLSAEVLIGSMGFQALLALLTVVVVVWRIDLVTWLGLRWRKWPFVFAIAPAAVVGIWILFGIMQFAGYMKWMESLGVDQMQESVKLLQNSKDPLILGLMAVAAVLVAPVCEEIVFRGYLYPVAKKFAGPWVAALCTGMIFAAAHGSLAALPVLAIFGFVLAVIYEKTGSIWATMAIHFCFNGATVALQSLARLLPHLLDQAK